MLTITRSVLLVHMILLISCSSVLSQDATTVLPADIDPESFSRLPLINKSDLDEEGQRIFDLVVGSERTTPPPGPVAASFYNPKVAEAMHILNQALRYNSVIGRRYTEVAILVASREFDQQYEWTMHENAAREEGVPESVIDIIKYNREIKDVSKEEALIIRYGREIMREHKLSSETFAEAVDLFGRQGAFEIAAIIGDYLLAGVMLHAVDQQLASDRKPLLPMEE